MTYLYAGVTILDKFGRRFGHKPVLYLNFETMRKKLFDYKVARIAVVNGKEVWKSIVRTYMLNLDDLEIVSQFNAEIRGFYNYYSIANNSYASMFSITLCHTACIRYLRTNTNHL